MIVEPDFFDHWKTRMLVDLLDGDEAAPVYVQRLWAHCQNRRQVSFENFPPAALKALCRYPGHPSKLESGLVSSGFVRRDGAGVFTVLNWEKYNAGLIANWTNGEKGGRPPKNPPETHGLSMGNPSGTDRAEQQRAERSRADKKQAEPVPIEVVTAGPADTAAAFSARGEVCSLLLGVHFGGVPLFDSKAAAAIASSPRATREQVAWAIERFVEERATEAGKARMRKPAGYLRSLIDRHEPPAGWVEKYRRAEIRKLAAKGAA